MYIRLRAYGQRGAIGLIEAEDNEGNTIPLTISNLLNSTGYLNNVTYAAGWFSGSNTGNRPYELSGQYAEINLLINNIRTIKITSYLTWGFSAMKVEVYVSEDNVNFTYVGDTIFTVANEKKALSVILVVNKILLLQENGEVNSIDSISKTITKIPSSYEQNLIKYGMDSPIQVDGILSNKNYILQDTVSEDIDGLWKTQLDRKPLNIRFD